MLSAYYKLWVDAIVFERTKKGRVAGWKSSTIIPISLLMGINLFTLLYWTYVLTHHELPLVLLINFFNNKLIDVFLSSIIMFFIPFLLMNYLVIFYNDRYETLIKIYSTHKGKWYRNYALISIGILIIPFLLRFIF